MSTPRLHLTRLPQAESFDAQASRLLAAAQAKLPLADDNSTGAIWNLAQYVDLVDAGYGTKDAVYAGAKARLAGYVRSLWNQPEMRGMFGRSAALMGYVNDQLDEQASNFEATSEQTLAA